LEVGRGDDERGKRSRSAPRIVLLATEV